MARDVLKHGYQKLGEIDLGGKRFVTITAGTDLSKSEALDLAEKLILMIRAELPGDVPVRGVTNGS